MTMRKQQRGVFLIEALMGILIFSLGILTLVAMQTAAVSAQSDAQYRIEASNLADEILGEIWLNVDRSNPAAAPIPPNLQTSLLTFQHHSAGAISSCNFTGADANDAGGLVVAWANKIKGAGGLPGASDTTQQITVSNAGGGFNQVSVTLCWQAPLDTSFHRHTVVTFVN